MPTHIPLADGRFTIVDDEDADLASSYSWWANNRPNTTYACAHVPGSGRRGQKSISLHRLLLDAPPGIQVDHIDHDGLNNRRSNLRLATNAQNQANRRKKPGAASRFRGVSWHKASGSWQACIRRDGRQCHLGHFKDETDAARAYDAAARSVFGDFALLNNP